MVQLDREFNANDVDPSTTFEVKQPGWYKVFISDTEEKETSAGDGMYVAFTYNFVDGGGSIWDNLNLRNKSEKAMEIAYRNLSAICHAVGKTTIRDTSELHNIPLDIKVDIEPAVMKPDGTVQYKEKNKITGWRACEVISTPQHNPTVSGQTTAATTPTPTAATKPPWER